MKTYLAMLTQKFTMYENNAFESPAKNTVFKTLKVSFFKVILIKHLQNVFNLFR